MAFDTPLVAGGDGRLPAGAFFYPAALDDARDGRTSVTVLKRSGANRAWV